MNLRAVGSFDHSEFGKTPAWSRGDGSVAIGNPRFAQVLHVWVCNADGAPMYDQILRAEQGGGVFLPVDAEGRIGLQQVTRPQTNDQESWAANWPETDVESLGRSGWEVPRGFANLGESGEDAASREAEEETGSVVVSDEALGQICDNTAMSPHLTAMRVGHIDLSRRSELAGDPNEKLVAKLQYFTLEEVKGMIREGEIYCGYTISAIGLFVLLYG